MKLLITFFTSLLLLVSCIHTSSETHTSSTKTVTVRDSDSSPEMKIKKSVDSLLNTNKSSAALELIEESKLKEEDKLSLKAYVYRKQGNMLKAFELLKLAVEISDNDYFQLEKLGLFLYEINELDSAKKYFEITRDLHPKEHVPYYNLGLIHADLKTNLDSVLYYYKKAIDIKPDYFQALNNYGYYLMEYRWKTDLDEAITLFEKCIQINDEYQLAYFNLGRAYMVKKDYDEGLKYFDQAVALKSDPLIVVEILFILINNENSAAAVRIGEEFKDFDLLNKRGRNVFHINLGIAYYDTGNKEKACEEWNQVEEEFRKEIPAKEFKSSCN